MRGRGSRGAPEFHGGQGDRDDPREWGWFFDGPDHHGWEVLARGLDERFDNGLVSTPCPFGVPGDHLWVRETWCLAHPDYHDEAEGLRLGKPMRDGKWCHYAASDDVDFSDGPGWRPSIHMPRWASRLTLEVTGVRVERLNDISEEDVKAEGIKQLSSGSYGVGGEVANFSMTASAGFRALWEKINGRGSWESNPWVWVVEFQRVTP